MKELVARIPQHQPELILPFPKAVHHEGDISMLFGQASVLWMMYFNKNLAIEELSYLKYHEAGADGREPSSEGIKEMRKVALILRNAYSLFDESHHAPQTLKAVTTSLGKVADTIKDTSSEIYIDEAIQALRGLPDRELPQDFEPCSITSFYDYYHGLIERLNLFLNEEQITPHAFHITRKGIVRPIMNLYRLRAIVEPQNRPVTVTYRYFERLNRSFGSVHDKLIKERLTGQIDYENSLIELNQELKSELRNLIVAHRR